MAVKAQKRLSRHRSKSHQRFKAVGRRSTRPPASATSESSAPPASAPLHGPASESSGDESEPPREPGALTSDWDGEPSGISSTGAVHRAADAASADTKAAVERSPVSERTAGERTAASERTAGERTATGERTRGEREAAAPEFDPVDERVTRDADPALTEDPAALEFFRQGDELERGVLADFFAQGDAIRAESYDDEPDLELTTESPWLTAEQRARRLRYRRYVARLIGALGVFSAGAVALRWFS